jgi:uncharacterized membrane protein
MTVALVTCLLSPPVLAQEETIELGATYPRIESAASDAVFKFTVDIVYQGDQARKFDLRASGPSGWTTYVSGAIWDNIELTAVVMPMYSLDLVTEPRFYRDREVTASEDNFLFITARNTGSSELTSIRFSADKPRDVVVEFQPEEIDRLAPGSFQEIQVNIKPSESAVDRYYNVKVIAQASQIRQTTTIGVRVEESKWLWGWVGAGITLLVIAGFTIIFLRLGRGK